MTNVKLIPCTHTAYETFAPYHYDSDTFNKSAKCWVAMIGDKQVGFCASISRQGKWGDDPRPARFAHKTVAKLPCTHPAYFKLWSLIADAQAVLMTSKGYRWYSQAPADHAAYRDDPASGWKKSSTKKVGYRSHEYIGMHERLQNLKGQDPRSHDYSFNFWIGCKKLSEGCKNCFMFLRQTQRMDSAKDATRKTLLDPSVIRRCTSTWGNPLKWQREAEVANEQRSVFACSYSDFFLPEADAWRDDAWALIRSTPNLTWLLASKRTELIAERLPADWAGGYPNVWLGTGAEMKKYLPRLDALRKIPCVLRWLDFAPCLEDLMPELKDHIEGFSWVNVSGEQGCGMVQPRSFDPQWARRIRDLCAEQGIAFSHPSGGGKRPEKFPLLDGVRHDAMPSIYSV
jgi:protein gp37